mgnify:CR=1 FL=1
MGIEPVCLLFGKKEEAGMVETHGQIIEMPIDPSLPWILQLILSKFYFPTTEPETTWLIGDIDLVPLQTAWFTRRLDDVPEDNYVHLNHDGISIPRLGCMNGFLTRGPQVLGTPSNPGTDIPGHYHVAKGRLFEIFRKGQEFNDLVRNIADSHRYGMGIAEGRTRDHALTNPYWYYWLAEEMYTSEQIWHAIKSGQIVYRGFSYDNNNDGHRVDRGSGWSDSKGDYQYTREHAINRRFVDVHCARPYAKQEQALRRLLELANML